MASSPHHDQESLLTEDEERRNGGWKQEVYDWLIPPDTILLNEKMKNRRVWTTRYFIILDIIAVGFLAS